MSKKKKQPPDLTGFVVLAVVAGFLAWGFERADYGRLDYRYCDLVIELKGYRTVTKRVRVLYSWEAEQCENELLLEHLRKGLAGG